MPTVRAEFFLLEHAVERIDAICVLTERYYRQQRQIYLHCDTIEQAEDLDQALWGYKPGAFIPHNLVGEGPDRPPPVQIGCDSRAIQRGDILIQVGLQLHQHFQGFHQLIECVDQHEPTKQALRQHFVRLRQHRCHIETHNQQTIALLEAFGAVPLSA